MITKHIILLFLQNDNCEGPNGFNGTCYTKQECATRDGTAAGECAQGYGVCCVSTYTYLFFDIPHWKAVIILARSDIATKGVFF